MEKQYFKEAHHFEILVFGMGSCMASDRITVDGLPVGFMYREEPDDEMDSGWRFLEGNESQEYLDDASHLGLYDVNTIANYDPAITPHLEAAVGSEFERKDGHFVLMPAEKPE